MNCENCGAPIVGGNAFCSRCGSPAPKAVPKLCGVCGAELGADDTVCWRCETQIASVESPEPEFGTIRGTSAGLPRVEVEPIIPPAAPAEPSPVIAPPPAPAKKSKAPLIAVIAAAALLAAGLGVFFGTKGLTRDSGDDSSGSSAVHTAEVTQNERSGDIATASAALTEATTTPPPATTTTTTTTAATTTTTTKPTTTTTTTTTTKKTTTTTTTTTAKKTTAATAPPDSGSLTESLLVGRWKSVAFYSDGEYYSADDPDTGFLIDGMLTFEIWSGGTGKIVPYGLEEEAVAMTWSLNGGVATIKATENGSPLTGYYQNGQLVLFEPETGTYFYMEKQ
ncbi:MAG: zinc ribbon domain-containing protein [Ruminococcus sp.]|nr:zinc ribbon domain-containing protein [Ruminococcus sp.]